MRGKNNEPLGFSWAYRDFLWALIGGFIALSFIAFLITSPLKSKSPYLGDIIIHMQWNPKSDSDIDLWVQSPKTPNASHYGTEDDPVGYNRQDGINCNLIRDDLGKTMDPESTNRENVVCLQKLSGLWIVDSMAYDSYDSGFPIWVKVQVEEWENNGYKTILEKTIQLQSKGDIQTVWQFQLDSEGNLIPGSVNSTFVNLYKQSISHKN